MGFDTTIGIILSSLLAVLVFWSIYFSIKSERSAEEIKVITDYFKYIIGSVALTLFTFLVNAGLKERRIIIEETEQIIQQVNDLVDSDSPERKKQYIRVFKTVARDREIRARWNILYNEIVNDLDKEISQRVDSVNYTQAYIDSLITRSWNAIEVNSKKIETENLNQSQIAEINQERKSKVRLIDSLKSKSLSNERFKLALKSELSGSNLFKVDLVEPCISALSPILEVINEQEKSYYEYVDSNYSYEEATKLFELNKKAVELLDASMIPQDLVIQSKRLSRHYSDWVNGYNSTLRKFLAENNDEKPDPNESFRVIHRGERFPTSASQALEAFSKNYCL